jgi:hypothetical protein
VATAAILKLLSLKIMCELIFIVGCYGGHFESKMAAKIQKSSYLGEIWFPSRLCCCELISIVGLLWRSELNETFQIFVLGDHFAPWLPWQRPPF